MAGPLGVKVGDGEGVNVTVFVMMGALVLVGKNVLVGVTVQAVMTGVDVYTPITTGAGVNTDGVGVDGKNGVGPGNGWMVQPLQDESTNINIIVGMNFFIFLLCFYFISIVERRKVPYW